MTDMLQAESPWSSQLPELVQSIARVAADDDATLRTMKRVCVRWCQALRQDGFWQQLAQERFGPEVVAVTPGLCRRAPPAAWGAWQCTYWWMLYASFTNALSDSTKSGVTWADEPMYFNRVDNVPGSKATTCLNLKQVCWLHAASSFTGIAAGKYQLSWHLKPGLNVGALDHLMLHAWVSAARDAAGKPLPVKPPPHVSKEEGELQKYNTLTVEQTAEGLRLMEQLPDASSAPATALHPLAEDGTFFKLKLPQDRLMLMAAETRTRWINIQVGLHIPAGAVAYDIAVALWNVNDWWKHHIVFDTVNLQLEGAMQRRGVLRGEAPAARSVAAASDASGSSGPARQADWSVRGVLSRLLQLL